MKPTKSVREGNQQMLIGKIKYLWKQIDWEVVQILVLVGMVPTMIIVGALFPSFLATYR